MFIRNTSAYSILPSIAGGLVSSFSAPTVLVFVEGQLTIRESGYFSLDGILKRIERYIDLLD